MGWCSIAVALSASSAVLPTSSALLFQDGRPEDRELQRVQKPKELKAYTAEWEKRFAHERYMDQALPGKDLAVVFAVSMKDDLTSDLYWDTIHRTWGSQRGVCLLNQSLEPTLGCAAYLVRVVGNMTGWQPNMDDWKDPNKPKAPEFYGHSFERDGFLKFNMTENMRRGKTFFILKTLAEQVPWATHIAKVDVDAYPYMYNLMSSLAEHQSCGQEFQYAGVPIKNKWCRERSAGAAGFSEEQRQTCEATMGNACNMPKCAFFNNGGLYLLSTSLVRNITSGEMGALFRKNGHEGPEDSTLGGTVFFGTRQCVASWSLLGSFHHQTGEGGAVIKPKEPPCIPEQPCD